MIKHATASTFVFHHFPDRWRLGLVALPVGIRTSGVTARLKTTIQAVRRLTAEGAIGVPLLARATSTGYLNESQQTWRLTSSASGGGVVLDIGVHDVDLLRYLLDDEVQEVTATTSRSGLLPGHLEDLAMTTLRFRAGTVASSTVSFSTPGAIRSIEVMGSEGTIMARDLWATNWVARSFVAAEAPTSGKWTSVPRSSITRRQRFTMAIRGEGQPAVSGEDGVRSLAVALAALRSAERGEVIKISELLAEESIMA